MSIHEALSILDEIRIQLTSYQTLQTVAKSMPPGFRSPATLRKLTTGTEPPVISYLRVGNGPILIRPDRALRDIELYQKRGIAHR